MSTRSVRKRPMSKRAAAWVRERAASGDLTPRAVAWLRKHVYVLADEREPDPVDPDGHDPNQPCPICGDQLGLGMRLGPKTCGVTCQQEALRRAVEARARRRFNRS